MMIIIARHFTTKQKFILPPWGKRLYRDPFDYPLRSLEEVQKEFEKNPITKEVKMQIVHHKDKEGGPTAKYDIRDAVVKMWVNMDDWNLTPKQKERLIFLLGPRYLGKPVFKIVSRQFPERDQNIQKCFDIIYELLMETKRAP